MHAVAGWNINNWKIPSICCAFIQKYIIDTVISIFLLLLMREYVSVYARMDYEQTYRYVYFELFFFRNKLLTYLCITTYYPMFYAWFANIQFITARPCTEHTIHIIIFGIIKWEWSIDRKWYIKYLTMCVLLNELIFYELLLLHYALGTFYCLFGIFKEKRLMHNAHYK